MSRIWHDENERNAKLLHDEQMRNFTILDCLRRAPTFTLTHPRQTLRHIKRVNAPWPLNPTDVND